ADRAAATAIARRGRAPRPVVPRPGTPAILPAMRPIDPQPVRRGLVVALDGPGSSGKSSVGAAAALELGYRFCDTGLLYRAVTWLALERGVTASDPLGLVALLREIALIADANGRLAHVSVDGMDVPA